MFVYMVEKIAHVCFLSSKDFNSATLSQFMQLQQHVEALDPPKRTQRDLTNLQLAVPVANAEEDNKITSALAGCER